MVLSEHNEPLQEKSPSEDPGDLKDDELINPTAPAPTPKRRFRSIEFAVLRGKFKRIHVHPAIGKFIQKIKNGKEKYFPNFQFKIIISPLINVILVIVIILLIRQVSSLKRIVVGDVLGGIYLSVGQIDQATLKTEAKFEDNIKVDFPLQIKQSTEVVLSTDTFISGAVISISTGGLNIEKAPADIILPAGSRLPVELDMTVPVNTSIPVSFVLPVSLQVSNTELHQPLVDLQNVLKPYLLDYMKGSKPIIDLPACKVFGFICNWWFK